MIGDQEDRDAYQLICESLKRTCDAIQEIFRNPPSTDPDDYVLVK